MIHERVALMVGLAVAACGGASEERVAALERQVGELKSQPAGSDPAALAQRVETVATETRAALDKLEEMFEIIQRETSALSARSGGGTAPAGGNAPDPVWPMVDTALGLNGEAPVAIEGENVTVARGWLLEELRVATAVPGKLPKFVADKKVGGVAVRAIKPKTLLDKLGIKNNDVVVAVQDKPTPGPEELSTALRSAGLPLVVKLSRKGKELVLRYNLIE